jgi:hypothetical protein
MQGRPGARVSIVGVVIGGITDVVASSVLALPGVTPGCLRDGKVWLFPGLLGRGRARPGRACPGGPLGCSAVSSQLPRLPISLQVEPRCGMRLNR